MDTRNPTVWWYYDNYDVADNNDDDLGRFIEDSDAIMAKTLEI